MQYPLFGDLQYAQVKNLTIAGPSYDAGAQAILAVKTRQVVVGNVTVDNMTVEGTNRQLPLVKTTTDVYFEYGNIVVTAMDAGLSPEKEISPKAEDEFLDAEMAGNPVKSIEIDSPLSQE